MMSQLEIARQAQQLLEGVDDGDDLTPEQVILVNFALCASATSLDTEGMRMWMSRALDAGITQAQLHEVVTLMSGIGVHAFFEASRALADTLTPPSTAWPPGSIEEQLWSKHVASNKYWTTMEEEIPGFLQSLLQMSPEAFSAFITFAGLPFRSRLVENSTLELISMAADACTSHQYLPGMRMHLRNAVRMGFGRRAVEQALQIAADSPAHVGVS